MLQVTMSSKKISRHKWNVLVAEDDLHCRAHLLKALSPVARCVTVENGAEAVAAYQKAVKKKQPFDFLLLDITMPELDGFQVLRAIRAEEETSDPQRQHTIKVVMITAYKDSLMERYNMGWDDFITKPVDVNKLTAKMRSLADSSGLPAPGSA